MLSPPLRPSLSGPEFTASASRCSSACRSKWQPFRQALDALIEMASCERSTTARCESASAQPFQPTLGRRRWKYLIPSRFARAVPLMGWLQPHVQSVDAAQVDNGDVGDAQLVAAIIYLILQMPRRWTTTTRIVLGWLQLRMCSELMPRRWQVHKCSEVVCSAGCQPQMCAASDMPRRRTKAALCIQLWSASRACGCHHASAQKQRLSRRQPGF